MHYRIIAAVLLAVLMASCQPVNRNKTAPAVSGEAVADTQPQQVH